MGNFRHTFRRWRSAILCNDETVELPPNPPYFPYYPPPPPMIGSADVDEHARNLYLEPLVDLSTMTIDGTWKDLPQEVVDHIMFMLGDNLESLKACSLTCKAMFVAARRLIHRKIFLTWEQNWDVLTLRERQRYVRGERRGLTIKMISTTTARGLLPHGRHLFIDFREDFTPANLQPFNDHFQRYERIQDLTIFWFHPGDFLEQFDTFFANFVPTLRSLHLKTPNGNTRDILDFVCRFPHLDNLTIGTVHEYSPNLTTWETAPLPVVKKVPSFRGRLKLYGISGRHHNLLQQLISLPGKRRFRFIHFWGYPAEMGQHIVDACGDTIETLSATWWKSLGEQSPLNFVNVKNLRSLTVRTNFERIKQGSEVLSQALHTITSPFFSEFVLEVAHVFGAAEAIKGGWGRQETWAQLDDMFAMIDTERGFRVVVRAEGVNMDSNFFAQARIRLPSMNAKGGLILEICKFVER